MGSGPKLLPPPWTMSSIKVTWTRPQHDGGSKITSYVVEITESEEDKYTSCANLKEGVLTFNITSLKEKVKYNVRVRAVNENGLGEPSFPVCDILTKDTSGRHIYFIYLSSLQPKLGCFIILLLLFSCAKCGYQRYQEHCLQSWQRP